LLLLLGGGGWSGHIRLRFLRIRGDEADKQEGEGSGYRFS
jgi:hypothetical protein